MGHILLYTKKSSNVKSCSKPKNINNGAPLIRLKAFVLLHTTTKVAAPKCTKWWPDLDVHLVVSLHKHTDLQPESGTNTRNIRSVQQLLVNMEVFCYPQGGVSLSLCQVLSTHTKESVKIPIIPLPYKKLNLNWSGSQAHQQPGFTPLCSFMFLCVSATHPCALPCVCSWPLLHGQSGKKKSNSSMFFSLKRSRPKPQPWAHRLEQASVT